ncbi:MAG: hypothetical protein ABR570_09415 [Burkholderiales bacterium]
MSAQEQLAIIRRIFVVACQKFGSAAHFADYLEISPALLRLYLEGRTMPSDEVLLKAVDLIIDEIAFIEREFSKSDWDAVFFRP